LYSQETPKENEVYTYIVPSLPAEKLIYEQIQRFGTEYTVYLCLKITNLGYDIHIIPTKDIQNEYYSYLKVTESNRTMHINGKLYYLVFYTDMTMGGKIELNKVQSFEKRESKKREDEDAALLVEYRHDINEYIIVIKFDRDWNQIKE
jgi:hypothetical protein